MRYVKTFLRMPLRQKVMIPRILLLMMYYRYLVHHRPFAELAPKIGKLGHATPLEATPRDVRLVYELMESMFRNLKWKDSCLIRALTAKRILNGMGYRCTLYMGVRKADGEAMTAHAWLRCGKRIVTGAQDMEEFTVTAIFGDPE